MPMVTSLLEIERGLANADPLVVKRVNAIALKECPHRRAAWRGAWMDGLADALSGREAYAPDAPGWRAVYLQGYERGIRK